VDRGDIITVAAGIGLVLVVAIVLKFGGILPQPGGDTGTVPPTVSDTVPAPLPTQSAVPSVPPAPATVISTPTPADPVPYRIYYSDSPLSYPVFRLPEHLETFGASEIMWKDPDIVPFAYIEESRSGITRTFNVPYWVWGVNISVEAWRKPQYARFDMAICNATDGNYIDAMEMVTPGMAFRSVQVSNWDMYLIVHMENVDRYRITFLTPRSYYNKAT
jgi:hypothetical protein